MAEKVFRSVAEVKVEIYKKKIKYKKLKLIMIDILVLLFELDLYYFPTTSDESYSVN